MIFESNSTPGEGVKVACMPEWQTRLLRKDEVRRVRDLLYVFLRKQKFSDAQSAQVMHTHRTHVHDRRTKLTNAIRQAEIPSLVVEGDDDGE